MSESHHQIVYTKNEVVITDVKIPFWSLLVIMVKVGLAAIPAVVILSIFGVFFTGLLGGFD